MSDIEPRDLSYHAQQSPVCYLVSPTKVAGVKDATARGWTQIAAHRFATPDKLDMRIICALRECVPTPGGTRFVKGADYDELSADEQERFGHFVDGGSGQWLEGL